MARNWFRNAAFFAALVTLLPLVLPALTSYRPAELGRASAVQWYGASLILAAGLSFMVCISVFFSGGRSEKAYACAVFAMAASAAFASAGAYAPAVIALAIAALVVMTYVLDVRKSLKRLALFLLLMAFFAVPAATAHTVLLFMERQESLVSVFAFAGGVCACTIIIGILADRLRDLLANVREDDVDTQDDGSAGILHNKP